MRRTSLCMAVSSLVVFGILQTSSCWTEAKTQQSSSRNHQSNTKTKPTSTSSNNPYQILGVKSSASIEEIKRQYHALAKEHHPDKGGNQEVFARIANAYGILSDPTQRRRFDQQQYRGTNQQPQPKNEKQRNAQRRAQQFQEEKRQQQQQRHPNPHRQSKPAFTTTNKQSRSSSSSSSSKNQSREERSRNNPNQKERFNKDRVKKAKQTQQHLLHVTSIEELLDQGVLKPQRQASGSTTYVFQKHFVGAFVRNKQQESKLEKEFLFPFPFWGKDDDNRNGLYWQSVLQTAKIRYNKDTELTRLMKIPSTNTAPTHSMPYIVFGRAGTTVDQVRFFTPQRQGVSTTNNKEDLQQQLQDWIERYLVTHLTIVNHHHSSIKLFLVVDQTGPQNHILFHTLKSGQSISGLASPIGNKLLAVDARVDTFPGAPEFDTGSFVGFAPMDNVSPSNPDHWYFQNPAVLQEYLVGLDTTLVIEESQCFDLSLQCQPWKMLHRKGEINNQDACHDQAEFMHHICPATCGICTKEHKRGRHQRWGPWPLTCWWTTSWMIYPFVHAPIYSWPIWLRPAIQFARFARQDFWHIWGKRSTIGSVGFTLGAVLGANAFLFPTWLFGGGLNGRGSGAANSQYNKLTWRNLGSLSLLSGTIGFWIWLHVAAGNTPMHRDWEHVFEWQMDALLGLIGWGCALSWTINVTLHIYWRRDDNLDPVAAKLMYSVMIAFVFVSFSIVGTLMIMDMDMTRTRAARWKHLWHMRKNVATALAFTGVILGQALPSLWKCLWRFPELVLMSVLNLTTIGALEWVSLADAHFWKDLNHVLSVRMSGAVPIVVVGLVLGFGVPFGALELVSATIDATQISRSRQNKIKME